jgi:hypothetical protein
MLQFPEHIAKQVADRRVEITQADSILFTGVFITYLVIVLCYALGLCFEKPQLYKMALVAIVGLMCLIARQELMIHRPAGWVKYVERFFTPVQQSPQSLAQAEGPKSWEEWKKDLFSTKFLLLPSDFAAAIPILYILYQLIPLVYKQDRQFVWWCAAGLIGGFVLAVVNGLRADK